ncbi:membrane protein [Robertmurraya siralis]|uniref:Membrane protein n=2 Tax=Robertmurraya TaxID=2837507 RepID=A0A919WE87_9BACI|nr:membrane protein [Robertmurraya siralis]
MYLLRKEWKVMHEAIIYIIAINVMGLYLMYSDKKRAKKNEYRISEKTLWTVALVGGAFGMTVGMNWFRHKTKHIVFKWGFPALALLQIGMLGYFLFE